jgi:threonine/homoserine/homoserine lactone efflux protein
MPVAPFMLALACLHLTMGVAWLSVLIAILRPIKRMLQTPGVVRWLDRITGVVFVGFGLKLALSERP